MHLCAYYSKYMYQHLISDKRNDYARTSQLRFSISDRKMLQRYAQENPYPQLFQIRENAKFLNTTVKKVKNWFRTYRSARRGFPKG